MVYFFVIYVLEIRVRNSTLNKHMQEVAVYERFPLS
jgi:hypothetical protein